MKISSLDTRFHNPKFLAGWVVTRLAEVLAGGILIFAGAMKGTDMALWLHDLSNLHIAPPEYLPWLAVSLPPIEIITGTCLMIGKQLSGARTIAICLLLAFTLVLGFAQAYGINVSCGCFGKLSGHGTPNYILDMMRNAILILACIVHPAYSRAFAPLNPSALSTSPTEKKRKRNK
jgi:hypothetical protein